MSLVFSCTNDNVPTDPEIPPHLQDQEQESGGNGDEGDSGQTGGGEGDVVVPPSGESMTVTVMSYNVGSFRGKGELDHEPFPEVAASINYADANVVGLNEVKKGQQNTLATTLGSNWSSWFYYAANSNYGNAIVYDNTSAVVNREHRVNIPKTDGASEVRSMGAVEFEDFVFCVTHLDHTSDAARMNGARLVTEWAMSKFGSSTKPVFLVGDMNTTPSNSVIAYFRENWTMISPIGTTFPAKGTCIDFIFALNNEAVYEVKSSRVLNKNVVPEAEVASDHYGLCAEVTFNRQK